MESSKKLFWFAHVERIALEQMSCAAYARRESLSLKVLYSWRYKFKLQQTSVAGGEMVSLKAGRVAPRFVAVQVSKSSPIESMNSLDAQLHCHLRMASGMSVEFAALPPAPWIASLELNLRCGSTSDARR